MLLLAMEDVVSYRGCSRGRYGPALEGFIKGVLGTPPSSDPVAVWTEGYVG